MNATAELQTYREHLVELQSRYDTVLETTGFDTVVLAAGRPRSVFLDDQHLPYKPNPYLLQWGPLCEHPGSALVYEAGAEPVLLVHTPVDFWHSVPPVPELIAAGGLRFECFREAATLAERVGELAGRVALIGEQVEADDAFGIETINPESLLAALNEERTRKTDWEIANMRAANLSAVRGHRAAEECFRGGGSEYDIQLAFRGACRATDEELPYPAIVAMNEHAATLHYQRLDRTAPGVFRSLLIDAGCAHHGYAADVTRTHSDDAEFGALVEAMHELQRALCEAAGPGVDYRELHRAAHHGIAGLLEDTGIVRLDPEAAVAAGITRSFFPHGLGHFLGLQVHDVGALYTRHKPGEDVPEGEDPQLRLTRILEPGNVLTVEPGLYFIEPLLARLAETDESRHVDWRRVDALRPFGGIRIEDNVLVTAEGCENLTRGAFAAVPD